MMGSQVARNQRDNLQYVAGKFIKCHNVDLSLLKSYRCWQDRPRFQGFEWLFHSKVCMERNRL